MLAPWLAKVLVPFAKAALAVIVAVVMLFEEWGAEPLHRFVAMLARWRPLAELEDRITRLPPYGALAVFAIPVALLIPVKLGALYLLAAGHPIVAIELIIAAKLVGTGIVARIYHLTRPQLMRIEWLAGLHDRIMPWKDMMYAYVRSSWAWRWGRIAKVVAHRRVTPVVRRTWLRIAAAIDGPLGAIREMLFGRRSPRLAPSSVTREPVKAASVKAASATSASAARFDTAGSTGPHARTALPPENVAAVPSSPEPSSPAYFASPAPPPRPTVVHQRIAFNLSMLLAARLRQVRSDWCVGHPSGLDAAAASSSAPRPDVVVTDTAISSTQVDLSRFYAIGDVVRASDNPSAVAARLATWQAHPSNHAVLLVRDDRVGATLHTRPTCDDGDGWHITEFTDGGDELVLPKIGAIGRLEELYLDTPRVHAALMSAVGLAAAHE